MYSNNIYNFLVYDQITQFPSAPVNLVSVQTQSIVSLNSDPSPAGVHGSQTEIFSGQQSKVYSVKNTEMCLEPLQKAS